MTQAIDFKREVPALFRWSVLVIISFAMFGNYYIYDSISPLADLLAKDLHFSDSDIGLLQGIYSFPNIIMVLIGGMIIDRIGTKKAALIFTVLVMFGAFVTALKGNLYTMAAGRLIFGLGAESMIVAITTIIARWFKGKELSFAFGLNLTVARLGSFLALNSPTWGKSFYSSWDGPLWITVGAGVFSVFCLIVFYFVDQYCDKRYNLEKEGGQDKVVFKELFSFGRSFWFITLLCVTFYSAMFPFQTFAIKFFQEVHGTSREVGGNLSSILTLAAMFCTPLFGLLADKIGKRSLLMMFGSLLIIPVYLIMAYKLDIATPLGLTGFINLNIGFMDIHSSIPVYLIIPMSMMGIAFSLIPAVMWPSVALIVKHSKLGTAYGLMTMIQNIGLWGMNVLIGMVNDMTHAYTAGMWLFSSLGFFGLLFSFLLWRNELGPNSHGLEFPKLKKE
ncbi:MAG: MFS transporter [Ignavibacteria bacterium GWB2_35_12]|nr:MAG: MFS transporter [Ignavibacteria bacterium GWA2_35_8]OGU38938.1 MAG: MFS transporter [Ignavibacteria bacterium GWB2_35_12]OGU88428.1 MAG: MFS transporter [Ignavibacteria bacterium RIFOXYA2_FULL_35_10]OGV20416.1 MAG: MFS transporter [Ignavibacteria bacterium RIFOXYC2_FULL_35_21]